MAEIKDKQDVDLTHFFNKIGSFFARSRQLFLRTIAFILRNFIAFVVLILLGAIIGYFLNKNISKPLYSKIIIYPNVQSTDYLYDAVEMLNYKIKSDDTSFIKKYGLGTPNNLSIKKIEVEPIVDIKNILSSYQNYDEDQVGFMLENIDPSSSYFENDVFVNSYDYHSLTIELNADSSIEILENVIYFLEDNNYLQQKIQIRKNNLIKRKLANDYTLQQLDSLLLNTNKSLKNEGNSIGQISIRGTNQANFNEALQSKSSLLKSNAEIEEDLLRLDQLFHITNRPDLFLKPSYSDYLILIMPALLILIFIGIVMTRKLIAKTKK
ncbi:MAG: hypothetical protein WBG71_06635 [Leeuwenhoekiella sp.]